MLKKIVFLLLCFSLVIPVPIQGLDVEARLLQLNLTPANTDRTLSFYSYGLIGYGLTAKQEVGPVVVILDANFASGEMEVTPYWQSNMTNIAATPYSEITLKAAYPVSIDHITLSPYIGIGSLEYTAVGFEHITRYLHKISYVPLGLEAELAVGRLQVSVGYEIGSVLGTEVEEDFLDLQSWHPAFPVIFKDNFVTGMSLLKVAIEYGLTESIAISLGYQHRSVAVQGITQHFNGYVRDGSGPYDFEFYCPVSDHTIGSLSLGVTCQL